MTALKFEFENQNHCGRQYT